MRFGEKLLGAAVIAMFLSGCSSYYAVRDPASGAQYYTTDVDKTGITGAVKFKDAKSGSQVTLQSSEVKEISKDEFTKGSTAPASTPAPAAAAAPAAIPAPAPTK
jgi:hypothetical protein